MTEELNNSNKRYISPDGLEERYTISKALQAKLRMNKLIPYTRPAGSRVVIYNVEKIEKWLEEWEVQDEQK